MLIEATAGTVSFKVRAHQPHAVVQARRHTHACDRTRNCTCPLCITTLHLANLDIAAATANPLPTGPH